MNHRVLLAALYTLIFLIPVGTRFLLHSFTPGFHEYEAVFIYLSDIPLLLCGVWYATKNFRNNKLITGYHLPLTIFLVLSFISIFFAGNSGLAAYSFARLLLAVIFAVLLGNALREKPLFRSALMLLAGLAVAEGIIAFLQFRTQGSIGLGFLGESPIGPFLAGTAKSILGSARVVRAYGTFPHPNVLGAFLLMGLSALYYFWFSIRMPLPRFTGRNYREMFQKYLPVIIKTIFLSVLIFMVFLGILLTFSRTAWALAVLISLVSIFYFLFSLPHRRSALKLLVVLISTFYFLFSSFSAFVLPRAHVSTTEPSVTERLSYNRLGLHIIRERPLGVGIGNQVLTGVEEGFYTRAGITNSKLWQPVHNIYLLIISEVGVLGGLAFIVFIAMVLISNFKILISKQASISNDQKEIQKLEIFISTLSLVSLLLFGLFDHFFWTLEQGRLMLWFAIGLAVAASSRPDAEVGAGRSKPTFHSKK